jgi:hypothetical protein
MSRAPHMQDNEDLVLSLLLGLLFSAIGLGYLVYAKRQRAPVPLLCGVALLILPYLVSDTFAMIAIGVLLMVIPYFIRL